MIGLGFQHLGQIGGSGFAVTGLLKDSGPQHQGDGIAGGNFDRLVEIGNRLRLLALEGEHAGSLKKRGGGIGSDIDCLVKGLAGLFQPFLLWQIAIEHVRHAKGFLQAGIIGCLFDARMEVFPGRPELVPKHAEQATGPADVGVSRGQFHRLVVVGGPRVGLFGEVAPHHMSFGQLQAVGSVWRQQFNRFVGGGNSLVWAATRQGLKPGDHQMRRAEARVAFDRLVEIPHGEGSHPRPFRVWWFRIEDGINQHPCPVDQGADKEVVGECLGIGREAFAGCPTAEVEHLLKVIEAAGRQFLLEGRIKIGLAGLLGGGLRVGRRRQQWAGGLTKPASHQQHQPERGERMPPLAVRNPGRATGQGGNERRHRWSPQRHWPVARTGRGLWRAWPNSIGLYQTDRSPVLAGRGPEGNAGATSVRAEQADHAVKRPDHQRCSRPPPRR